jgi:hypothetical protein
MCLGVIVTSQQLEVLGTLEAIEPGKYILIKATGVVASSFYSM